MSYIILFSVLYSIVFLLLYFSVIAVPTEARELNRKASVKDYLPYAIGFFAVFLLELCISSMIPGHKQDSGLFEAWTSFGLEHKMSEYYTTDLYVDYPPVYLTILYGIGKIAALLGIDPGTKGYIVAVKFIPILCDVLFTLLIFVLAKDKFGLKKAGAISLLTALNPAMLVNSAIWGQADSFVLLLTLAMLFTLYNKKYIVSCAMFALSFLTKPQMIIFAPLVGFTILADFAECLADKKQWTHMLVQIGLSLVAVAVVLLVVPLPVVGTNYGLLIERYQSAMGLYPYATLNAANLYGAFGLNWADVSGRFLFFDYQTWGFFFIAVMSVLVGVVSFRTKDRKRIFYLGAFTVATIYMLAHTMHERYLFSLMPILLLIFILMQDRKALLLYGAFSLTQFVNVSRVLLLNLQDDFIYGDDVCFILLSWVQLILYALMVWTGYRALFAGKTGSARVPQAPGKTMEISEKFTIQPKEKGVRIGRKDVLMMAVLTLVYAAFAFYNLGSHSVPESGWYVETSGESVVVDLGEVRQLRQLYAYSGWIDRRDSDSEVKRDVLIEVSQDGETWEALDEPMELSDVWRWKVTQIDKRARFVHLIPDDGRFYINELAFFGESEEERYLPATAYSTYGNETAAALIDEQDRVVYDFSWYDGTYFDEIYHPRTAYEHLMHRYPYENTHPPLGKVIIACGIALFGMNPFGWRFFGALCGVLMVPMAYMLGKRMFKSTFFAFCTAFLFAFDFMHLSQTRLATIDSYTVFFVMGMYYFMYRYISKSFYHEGLKKTLPPLFLSGVFFGLGAATKWQGIYAGAGLAFLFFASLVQRYREYRLVKRLENRDAQMEKILRNFKPMAIKTVLCGALFFVVVPGVIYFLSYIPAMLTPSTGWEFFFSNQPQMYHYHSGLTADHPYGSAWWSWPLDLKPLYAYSPNRSFVPRGTSMGISSFGNPLVWWLTIPVIVGAIVLVAQKKGNRELSLILAGFLSMYLPWVLVPRVAFIYHFFPCVIFVVLGIVYFMKRLTEKNGGARKYIFIYLAAVLVLFVMFYPVLTGIAVPTVYVEICLKWLPTWVLG